MTLSHALAAVACWQLSPALLDPWLLPHNVQVGFLGSGDQTQQLGSQIPMPLGWSQLYLRQNNYTVSGQTRSNLLPESFMPKTKHQRIPDEKKIVSVAQSPVSLQNHHNFTAATKNAQGTFFSTSLDPASFGRWFRRLFCSFRCRTFFGTCLEPSKEVLVQGVEGRIKRDDLEKPTCSTDSALAETIQIPAWCHLSQALVPQHVQGNRAHTNSSQTTTHRLLHIHQYTSGIYARGKHCSPSKNSTWRSIQPSFLRLLLQLCHRQRIELALWRRVTTSRDTRWISWCATCFSALPHRWHQLVHRVLEAWSTFFISKIPKICSTISQRGWPKIKFMKQFMFRFRCTFAYASSEKATNGMIDPNCNTMRSQKRRWTVWAADTFDTKSAHGSSWFSPILPSQTSSSNPSKPMRVNVCI